MPRGHGGGRRRGGGHKEEASDERWLLTYADMITLLMALFMVLFSISSVNISKVQVLQKSLRAAFSGDILPGGKAIAKPGASANTSHAPSSIDVQAIVPVTAPSTSQTLQSPAHTAAGQVAQAQAAIGAQNQARLFTQIKHELDEYARIHGFGSKVQTSITPRGLVIKVLTDDLLFASGEASLNTRSNSLLSEIGRLLNLAGEHPIEVEGNTDNVPIHSGAYPSNWELSTARASTVVRFLAEHGVGAARMTAAGFADQRPVASDATAAGRARNRRVEIVLKRVDTGEGEEP
ncbi:MAG TPA: flagellar motor protein MotB [Solirubrobacteraceae bacterium]|nr:flagellar motor protein MotB [Solirubrobacteraceae bacterium]